jgi:hypothetical protein
MKHVWQRAVWQCKAADLLESPAALACCRHAHKGLRPQTAASGAFKAPSNAMAGATQAAAGGWNATLHSGVFLAKEPASGQHGEQRSRQLRTCIMSMHQHVWMGRDQGDLSGGVIPVTQGHPGG